MAVSSPGGSEALAWWRRETVEELQHRAPPSGRPAPSIRGRGHPAEASRTRVDSTDSADVALRSWESVRTVSLHEEEHLHHQAVRQVSGVFHQWWWATQGWILAILVGICSAFSGVAIEVGVNHLSSIRFGHCEESPFSPLRACPRGKWLFWGDGAGAFLAFVVIGTGMAAASATLVAFFAPAASGSGIPEVKTILNGFVMPEVVSFRTLCVKVPGLVLSVAAGMSLGKEGPLVHVAVCWAQLLSGLFPQFQNEGKRRELFSAAAAAGVSTAFGAPLGGVLFSLEEVSTHFPSRTLLRAFTAAVSAAVMLTILHTNDTKGLTLFSVTYRTACDPLEYIGFAILGVLGGLVGAVFNAVNLWWAAVKAKPYYQRRVNGIVEVTLIALVTLLSSWPLALTRPLSADAIHAMFKDCGPGTGNSDLRQFLGLCTADERYAEPSGELMAALAGAALLRLCQTILTFGTACPAGLFVPSLFTGACLGRCMGVAMQRVNANHALFPQDIEPGVYSMVGAAAVLGGVCRVTISLVAVMLELTGGMTYIVPFMLAVLVAKMVGDLFTEGIYDLYVVLRGYPFLKEELSVTFTERCCDIMEPVLTKIDTSGQPLVSEVRELLDSCHFRGFPVVHNGHFVGYIKRAALEELLDQCSREGTVEGASISLDDLLPFTDTTVMRMVPDVPLTQVHKVFKQLGCKLIFLVGAKGNGPQDILQGMLTKKNFILYLKSGKVGHMVNHPSTGWPEQFALNRRPPRCCSGHRNYEVDEGEAASPEASAPTTPGAVSFRALRP